MESSEHKLFWKTRRFFGKTNRIMKYARPYWRLALALFIITALLSLLSLTGPYLVKILLDDILPYKNVGLLLQLMAIFILLFVVKTLVGIWHSYQTTRLVENMVLDVKKELFEHLENLDLSFYHTRRVGDLLYRIDEDVYSIDSFIDIVIDVILLNIMNAIFILIICLNLNWKVTVLTLAFLPFFVISQRYFGEKIRKQKKAVIEKISDLLSFLEEHISGIRAIKSFALETIKLDEYTRKSKKIIRMDLKMDLLESFSESVIGLITFVPMLIILWYGSHQVIQGALTVGSLIAIYTYIGKLFDPVASLGSINVAIQSTLVSVNRVFQIMDTKTKINEKPDAIELKNAKGSIKFKDVSFGYYPGENVIKKINFEINPGEMVGLVGPSGAGKSTVGNLLCRFFDPNEGAIFIDGYNLKDLKLKSIRQNIGIVSQETILFNTSIKENIKFGKPDATDREVIEAAKLANIHDFIIKQNKGYNTKVGERGVRLSGGEKQRISIARVILKNPKIIILDEATSSLDSESEKKIQESLQKVTKGRTTLVIAHRLSTIKTASQILVLKDSRILEAGSFSALMRKKGEFFRFYKTQFFDSRKGKIDKTRQLPSEASSEQPSGSQQEEKNVD